jgi:hypothetical protein
MASNDSWIQLSLEEKYGHDFEQIMTGIRDLGMAVAEVNRKLDNYNERLVALEQQRTVSNPSPVPNVPHPVSKTTTTPETAMKKEGAQDGRSLCGACTFTHRCCKYYFDDLYNIGTQEFNTNTGVHVERLICSCGHPIRIHDRDPSMSLRVRIRIKHEIFSLINSELSHMELPSFAKPPLGQLLYEELVPPPLQDWIWCK